MNSYTVSHSYHHNLRYNLYNMMDNDHHIRNCNSLYYKRDTLDSSDRHWMMEAGSWMEVDLWMVVGLQARRHSVIATFH